MNVTLDYIRNIGELDRGNFIPFHGKYIEEEKANKFTRGFASSLFALEGDYLEFSVYDDNDNLVHWREKESVFVREDLKVLLPVFKDLEKANLPNNPEYSVRYNFFSKALGSSLGFRMYVQEISESRDEIRVVPLKRGIENTDSQFNQEFFEFFEEDFDERYLRFAVNFGNNFYYHIINWELDNESFDEFPFGAKIKLLNPLPDQIDIGEEFWVAEEKAQPYFDKSSFVLEQTRDSGRMLAGPNFDIEVTRDQLSDTGFQTYESLVGEDYTTTQKLVNKMLNGEEQVKLNVDFTDFSKFVKFSSAEERVLNFQYKLSVIQRFQSELEQGQKANSNTLGSFQDGLASVTKDKIAGVVNGLDMYEQFLYEETVPDAYPKNEDGTLVPLGEPESNTWFQAKIEEAKEFDKRNNDSLRNNLPLYIKQNPQNGQFVLFVDMIGHYFDLIWLYIEHFKYRTDRSEFIFEPESLSSQLTHFLSKSFGFELFNGFDLEELFEQVFSEDDSDQIYYAFSPLTGAEYDQRGNAKFTVYPYASEKKVRDRTYGSGQDVQKQIWRRLLNSLPLIQKSAGTERSIRALLSAYGIPATGLTIREFGGTNLEHEPTLYEVEDLTHELNFFGNQHLISRWDKDQFILGAGDNPDFYTIFPFPTTDEFQELTETLRDNPKSVEVRFKSNFQANIDLTLFEIEDKIAVKLVKSNLDDRRLGKIVISYEGGEDIDVQLGENLLLFDDVYYTFLMNISNEAPIITFKVQRASIFGNLMDQYEAKMDFEEIALGNPSFDAFAELFSVLRASNIYVGGNPDSIINQQQFIGQIDFFRLWRTKLGDFKFDEHTKAPFKYDYDNSVLLRDAIKLKNKEFGINRELLLNLDFTEIQDLSDETVILNESPNLNLIDNIDHVVEAVGYTTSEPDYPHQFNRYYRTNLVATQKSGANALFSDKIRTQEVNLKGTLKHDQKREIGPEQGFVKDSGKLGVYFSPQQGINEDIMRSLGLEDVNELVGDPQNLSRSEYPLLGLLNRKYWQKYQQPINIDQYFRYIQEFNRAFFTHVRKLVPARVTLSDGLLLEPHILERYREKIQEVSSEDLSNEVSIDVNDVLNQEAEVTQKEGRVDIKDVLNQSGEYATYKGESARLGLDIRFAGNYTEFGRERQRYSLDKFYTNFDEEVFEELETQQERAEYLSGLNRACSLRKIYRRPPFEDLLIDFIFPIQNPEIFTHREYLYLSGGSFVYADPLAETESPFEGQEDFIAVYDECTFYSEPPVNVSGPTGESIRKPLFPYERYRHFFYNREFATADKRMRIEGVVNTRETTLDKEPPVQITFTEPERLIVSPTDRDASGAVLEVD